MTGSARRWKTQAHTTWRALNYLPLGAHLELLAVNAPLRADEWVPRHCGQFHPPGGLDPYVAHLADAYRRELDGQHIPGLHFYAGLSLSTVRERHRRGARSESAERRVMSLSRR